MSDVKDVQNSENQIKGTLDRYTPESGNSLTKYFNLRDVALGFGAILSLQLLGLIDLPFMNRLSQIQYADLVSVVILSIILTYATIWRRFSSWLESIYSKNWTYITLEDASGEYSGSWKTDPETFNMDSVDIDGGDSEIIKVERRGADVPNRRYLLVKNVSVSYDEDGKKIIKLENIETYGDIPEDDQIIASKDELKYWETEVLEDAKEGYEKRQGADAIKQRIIALTVKNIAKMYEHAGEKGVVDIDAIYEEVLSSYEAEEIEQNDMVRDKDPINQIEQRQENQKTDVKDIKKGETDE